MANDGDKSRRGDARDLVRALRAGLTAAEKKCLGSLGLNIEGAVKLKSWAGEMKEAAFRHLSRTIVYRSDGIPAPP